MSRKAPPIARSVIRCAIYTRKSTEEGLEQEFNSLHAQRESAEAYIASQRAEGWTCIPDRYDDGGYTGGNMERPALQRLMADIEAGAIDCVVVYKVDRLSRSLLDFARMMGVFEKRGVSFVSVTQQFNTAHSMGRLMLNVLLSFAQFEREIISERTRDKIAAARRKGKWSGGKPLLGYDLSGGKLRVNEAEAQQVREIFEVYLKAQSLSKAVEMLIERGYTTKAWTTGTGRVRGGGPLHKSYLQKLLTNVAYLGMVRHHSEVYPGEQPAIVGKALFDRVQGMLRLNGHAGGSEVRNKYGALLKGLLCCGRCGAPMGHTFTRKKNGVCYRYYLCHTAQAKGRSACPGSKLPAAEVERFVVERARPLLQSPEVATLILNHVRATETSVTRAQVSRHLGEFEPLWECLSPKEQAGALRLVIQRVEYSARAGEISITFLPGAEPKEAVA